MKKIYKLMALTAAIGIPAVMPVETHASVTEMSQVIGNYRLDYMEGSFEESITFNSVEGDLPNQIVFQNFYYIEGMNIPATVDFSDMTVTFNTVAQVAYDEKYQGYCDLQLYQYNRSHTRYSPTDKLVGTLNFDGTIEMADDAIFAIIIPEGRNPQDPEDETIYYDIPVFMGEGTIDEGMKLVPVQRSWTYDPSEWTYGGQALLKDMWLAPELGYNLGSAQLVYSLDYLVNVYDSDRFLIENPYGQQTIWGDGALVGANRVNQSTETGYIYINADDPEFVKVWGPVFSGYSSNDMTGLECWNEEGYRSWQGATDLVVKQLLESWGLYSFSSRSGNTIQLYNLIRMYEQNPYDYLPENYITTITLTPGEGGVNGVNVNNDTPVRYYNIQGQEVINPEKGQLVIKRQGETTEKMIVR